MNRDAILAAHPLPHYLSSFGCELTRKNGELWTRCLFHDDHHPSLRINPEKQTWYCDVCGFGGSVIDMHARHLGISVAEAMKRLAEDTPIADSRVAKARQVGKTRLVETYEYTDIAGSPRFFVDRMEPVGEGKKSFVQWHLDGDGRRLNGISGVERVLYRLPRVAVETDVMLLEGEKCVHAAESLGFVATTNPGGSNGWLPAFAESLADKDVTICPDNDEPGKKWVAAVMDSLEGVVASVRVCRVPKPHNDLADVVAELGPEKAMDVMSGIMFKTPRIPRGVDIPVLPACEMMERYRAAIESAKYSTVDLSRWLPSFSRWMRPLSPGDMFLVLASTGGGKTAVAQNIAISQNHATVLLFELELAAEQMAERFAAITNRCNAKSIEHGVRNGKRYSTDGWDHVWTCPKAKITVDEMEAMILRSELKIGKRPDLVLVDYVGLVRGGAGKRYERMSTIAEELKVMARSTGTVVGVCSQVRRMDDDDPTVPVRLTSGKDSGSLENSAQLVLGAWRPDPTEMLIQVLKRTNGPTGAVIHCNFDGPSLRITERAWSNEGEDPE